MRLSERVAVARPCPGVAHVNFELCFEHLVRHSMPTFCITGAAWQMSSHARQPKGEKMPRKKKTYPKPTGSRLKISSTGCVLRQHCLVASDERVQNGHGASLPRGCLVGQIPRC